jgi:hypothetical protein
MNVLWLPFLLWSFTSSTELISTNDKPIYIIRQELDCVLTTSSQDQIIGNGIMSGSLAGGVALIVSASNPVGWVLAIGTAVGILTGYSEYYHEVIFYNGTYFEWGKDGFYYGPNLKSPHCNTTILGYAGNTSIEKEHAIDFGLRYKFIKGDYRVRSNNCHGFVDNLSKMMLIVRFSNVAPVYYGKQYRSCTRSKRSVDILTYTTKSFHKNFNHIIEYNKWVYGWDEQGLHIHHNRQARNTRCPVYWNLFPGGVSSCSTDHAIHMAARIAAQLGVFAEGT